MTEMSANTPGYVMVSSAMRTGSTWMVRMLRDICQAPDRYVSNVEDALQFIKETNRGGIIKTHDIVDVDWRRLPLHVPIVRITRNFKDSLISRALYAKNIRTSEGGRIEEFELKQLLEEIGEVTDQEFISAFFDRCSLVENWLANIVVMERGHDERCHTLTYEQLMHNPFDVMLELTDCLWPEWTEARERVKTAVKDSIRVGYKERETFLRKLAVGVGGWENWLSVEQSERLDELYWEFRDWAHEYPALRWSEVLTMKNSD